MTGRKLRATALLLALAATVAFALAPPTARAAEPRDPAGAEALFEAAKQERARGAWVEACAKFAESERLDPAAGTLLNLADCEEHLGKIASAWEHWQEGIGMMPSDDDRLPGARARVSAIEKRVPRLRVKLAPDAPADTHVARDDVEIRGASLDVALPVNPGSHEVVATAPGRRARKVVVALAEGDSKDLVIGPGEAESVTGPARPPAVDGSKRGLRTAGYVVGAVGIGALAVGGVTGIFALDRKARVESGCDPAKGCTQAGYDAAQSGKTFATESTITTVAGAALIGVGAALVLWIGRDTVAGAAPLPGGASVAISTGF